MVITGGDAVIVDEDGRSLTLTEKLIEIGGGITISEDQPDRPCVWYQIKSTEVVD